MIEWIAIVLTLTNVFQFIYWSRQTHKLIDKLMCRNYAEYVHTERLKHDLPHARADEIDPDTESFIDEDLKTLNNTMAGLL